MLVLLEGPLSGGGRPPPPVRPTRQSVPSPSSLEDLDANSPRALLENLSAQTLLVPETNDPHKGGPHEVAPRRARC